MFAHRVVAFTGPDAVQWTQVEEPRADDGVVIDVVAAGVSFADLLQTTGAYQLKVPCPSPPAWMPPGWSAPPGPTWAWPPANASPS
jgi:NADPH:quinone reductase